MEMLVLRSDDLDKLIEFENLKLEQDTNLDFMEKQMKSWHARWRKESLEHYLPLGWSFGIWDDDKKSQLLGYVLCQPILFFRGLTQTLWVEHLSANDLATRNMLGEIVYRWARDKHLQQIILPKEFEDTVSAWNSQTLDSELVTVNTSKLRN